MQNVLVELGSWKARETSTVCFTDGEAEANG